ncbi:MAG: FliG C-terminal domain-containing protein [Rubripirellula sp.]
MANGWNSGPDREATLRRVAIVLSSLPGSVASQLMGGIDPNAQQEVRRTMATLSDVDPLERKRALHAFKVSVEQPSPSPDLYQASGATTPQNVPETSPVNRVDPQAARQAASRVVPSEQARPFPDVTKTTDSDTSPLAFLGSVDDESLVQLLGSEHPQTVALVLASISPDQAARVLPRLESGLQSDALSRIGRLGEIPEEAVAEVAAHFRGCLSKQSSSERTAIGRRALDAILAAMPTERETSNGRSQENDSHKTESPGAQSGYESNYASMRFPSAERAAADLGKRLRGVEQEAVSPSQQSHSGFSSESSPGQSDASSKPSPNATETQGLRVAPASSRQPVASSSSVESTSSFPSTDAIHKHLITLSAQQLCETLGRVDTRVAMLALCGLPNQVTESVLAVLPRSQAKQVRQRMNSLGSLQLREIDQAKEAVAQASVSSAKLPIPQAA